MPRAQRAVRALERAYVGAQRIAAPTPSTYVEAGRVLRELQKAGREIRRASLVNDTLIVSFNRIATYNPSLADPSHDYCYCWAPELAYVAGTLELYFSAHQGPKGGTTCLPPSGSEVTTYRAISHVARSTSPCPSSCSEAKRALRVAF